MSKRTGAAASSKQQAAKATTRTRGPSPSDQDLVAIRTMHAEGRTTADLAKLFGLSIFTVRRIVYFRDHYALPAGEAMVPVSNGTEVSHAGQIEDVIAEVPAATLAETTGPAMSTDPEQVVDAFLETLNRDVVEDEDLPQERILEIGEDVGSEAGTVAVVDTVQMKAGTDLVVQPQVTEATKADDVLLTIIAADCRMVIVDPDFGRSRIDAQDVFRDFLADLHGPVRVEIGSAGQAFRERVVSDLRNAMFHLSRNDIVVVRDGSYRIERVKLAVSDPLDASSPAVDVTIPSQPSQPSCPTALALRAHRVETPEAPFHFDENPVVHDDAEGVAIADMLDTVQEASERDAPAPVVGDPEMSTDFGPAERRRGLRRIFGIFGRNRATETA